MLILGCIFLGCSGDKSPKANDQEQPTAIGANNVTDGKHEATNRITLQDWTAASGITFVHAYDGHDQYLIAEVVAAGLASFDYDLDGWIDLYFLNGADLLEPAKQLASDQLNRNLGKFKFVDVTAASGLTDFAHSVGVATADFNNDGFSDIYLSNFGKNHLFQNNGDGTFSDATELAGVACGDELGAGVCFIDINLDGCLDLYVGNYVKDSISRNPVRTTEGFRSYPGPLDFQPEKDYLFLSQGDGTFLDVSETSGIRAISGPSMGMISSDLDDDGDLDILIACDVHRNLAWINDGHGSFIESGISLGLAFSGDGKLNGNMGVDAGDFDGDGAIDYFITTYRSDFPVLYKNDGAVGFQDVTQFANCGASAFQHVKWGTAFVDLDNSGTLDLLIANGDTDPLVEKWAYTTSWKARNTLLMNKGNGRFEDVTESVGSGLAPVESSRGLIVDDLDNDGRVDVVVLNSKTIPSIIRNTSINEDGWVQIELHGIVANRDAVGAKVTVKTEHGAQVAEVYSGRGYQSSFGQRLHFGLGAAKEIQSVQVRWPSGRTQVFSGVSVAKKNVIVELPE